MIECGSDISCMTENDLSNSYNTLQLYKYRVDIPVPNDIII